jgi:hypothetical protein
MGSLTCTKAVERIIPVPNCLMTVDTTPLMEANGSFMRRIGAKTPIALVARTTNNVPMRKGTS